ncbi:MAG TPA: hypothetical protein VMU10_04965 [Desulfomonilia bacterium]|nr:hypothetical protein [Desulfomonilia bacterium]
MNRQIVERFVRGTLGCECPDEVFERISISPVNPCPGLPVDGSLEVGGRLLIYISTEADIRVLRENLEKMILEGKKDRDKRGFNRFRLVIATGSVKEIESILAPLFGALALKDDKVHLHVVRPQGIKDLMQLRS